MARPEPKHGTRTKYVNYRCRCEPCSKANRDYQREYMRKTYAPSTHYGAKNNGWFRVDGSVRLHFRNRK